MNEYLKKRQELILQGRPLPEKKKYTIPKKSEKRKQKEAEERILRGGDETIKERWFKDRRIEMVGTCQCGCGCKSSKYDNKHFRSSICHIFPQRLFPSIQFHPLNWVERKFWATKDTSACHSQMDNKSMDLWPNFADWDDIKEKFHQLSPILTYKEIGTKFYKQLSNLVYGV